MGNERSRRLDADERDRRYMRQALALARRGRGRTEPNPRVGAVVVKGDRVVGKGYHRRAGTDHAEIVALRDAGRAARRAVLYVNLEPCCHQGLTGPCADAVIDAGVRRVVIGMIDPNPLVCRKGVERLRGAGVEVRCGVLEQECRDENRAFATHILERRPHVTLKAAMTLDGRVAAASGHARWVTGAAARAEGHRLRGLNQAIAVGIGTVIADDPQLTCRPASARSQLARDPIRVVIDSRLRTPPAAKVVAAAATSQAPTWILATRAASVRRAKRLEQAGARVVRVSGRGGRVSIRSLLTTLGRLQVVSLLLEGGPTLAGSFWQQRLVDEVVAFVAPKILGDPAGLPMLRGAAARTMNQAVGLSGVEVRRVGEDLMIAGKVFGGARRSLPGCG